MTNISTTAFDGNVAEFAKGNHRHALPFSVVNTLIGGNTVTSMSISSLNAASISGSITGSINVVGNISGSSLSTASFGSGNIDNKLGIGTTT